MNNVSDDVIQFEQTRQIGLQKVTAIMLAVFGVIGVIGNAVILMVYWKLVKMTTTQFLIFVIAIFDFLTAFVAVPISVVTKTYWFQIVDIYYCKIVHAIISLCIFPGTLLLFIVTFVRYCHVCRPNLLRLIEPKIKFTCVLSVMFGLFYCYFDAYLAQFYDQNEITGSKSLICTPRPSNVGTKIIFASRFPIIIAVMVALVVLNILIIKKNHQAKKSMRLRSQVNIMIPSTTSVKEHNMDKRDTLNQFFHVVDENQSLNSRNGVESSNVRRELNTNDNSKQGEDCTSKSETLCNNTSVAGSTKTNETQSSNKRSVNKSEQPASVDIGNDIKSGLSVRRSVSKKKKTGRYIDQCSDHSFKGLSRTTVMLSLVSVVYVLSYLPICSMIVIRVITGIDIYDRHLAVSEDVHQYLLFPLHSMYFLGCTANPIIYTFVNPSFRSKCRSLFRL